MDLLLQISSDSCNLHMCLRHDMKICIVFGHTQIIFCFFFFTKYFFCGSFMFLFCLVFAMSLCASIYMCFVVTCWERADLLALVCGVCCEFVTFPLVSWVSGLKIWICLDKILKFCFFFLFCELKLFHDSSYIQRQT